MKYVSTRGGVAPTSLDAAILAGLAPDGGLFVPAEVPAVAFPDRSVRSKPADSLVVCAQRLLEPFFARSGLASELPAIVREAFTFDAPLQATRDPDLDVLELFHGPTAAFKDFGARFLAATMRRLRASSSDELTMLVATSGDTGSAVGAAFHGMPGVRVVILYPDGRVSPRQAHQLGCFGDNVAAIRIAGTFDDCQRLVKQAFADRELRDRRSLASANSISLGRLLPQMSYYAAAAESHSRVHQEPLNVVVPTGNLGNAVAAILARACGAPLGAIVLATNANRVLPDFLGGAPYEARPSLSTLANAMDVGNPSNVERLRWLYENDDKLRDDIAAFSVDDDTIKRTIREGEARYGHLWCPHTACAVAIAERVRTEGGNERRWAVVATAHPAKFDTIVEPIIGKTVPVPPALAAMLERPSRAESMPADYATLRARLLA
jgi:threonine synthase